MDGVNGAMQNNTPGEDNVDYRLRDREPNDNVMTASGSNKSSPGSAPEDFVMVELVSFFLQCRYFYIT